MKQPQPQPAAPSRPEKIALVLQGGGALGSYQGGVYAGLSEAGYQPDWIAGISIGAINAALIAGNPPETQVAQIRAFWDQITETVWGWPINPFEGMAVTMQKLAAQNALLFGQPGFFAPRKVLEWVSPTKPVSYYDTSALKSTLERLVDFDRINAASEPRLSVGAVNVRTGRFAYFDSTKTKIRAEHIMASGALPPGFPAVEIDGEHYWDGGLVSNTPLDYVLEEETQRDLLIFQIDLFSQRGALPTTLLEAVEREKDIRYSSRTRLNTDLWKKVHNTRKALRDLIELLPDDLKSNPLALTLAEAARENAVTVVHLIYRSKNFEAHSKDYDFSRVAMLEHWTAGERDVHTALRHPEWLDRPQAGQTMVTYDLTADGHGLKQT